MDTDRTTENEGNESGQVGRIMEAERFNAEDAEWGGEAQSGKLQLKNWQENWWQENGEDGILRQKNGG